MAYIVGTAAAEVLSGTAADDEIYGEDGKDTLRGGGGNDALYGGRDSDTLAGEDGNDLLHGSEGADSLSGGTGNDTLVGGDGEDTLDGGAGDDFLFSYYQTAREADLDRSVDILKGGAGADTFGLMTYLRGDPDPAVSNLVNFDRIADFSAAEGDKLLLVAGNGGVYPPANATWCGEITNTKFSLTEGKSFGDGYRNGYVGIFTWTTSTTTHVVIDTNGDGLLGKTDFVIALDGVHAIDRYSFLDSFYGRELYIVGTTSSAGGSWTGADIAESFIGSAAADTASGLGGADKLAGGGGADILYGGAGDDLLYGQAGADTLEGGDGDDTLYANVDYNSSSDVAGNLLRGGAGNDLLRGGGGGGGGGGGRDTLEGGEGNDTLDALAYSSTGGDLLLGGAGDDILSGSRSTLDGGDGNDWLTTRNDGGVETGCVLTGGAGADKFTLGSFYDSYRNPNVIADFSAAEGDKISFTSHISYGYSFIIAGAIDNSSFSLNSMSKFSLGDGYGPDFQQIWSWSNAGYSYLIIDRNSNGYLDYADEVVKFTGVVAFSTDVFVGLAWAATGAATNAADAFTGGIGNDLIYGLGGADTLSGGEGNDTLYGNVGDDSINGGAGNDTISGGWGNDVIDGGDGDDQLFAGRGNDVVHGGAGNDFIRAAGYPEGDSDANSGYANIYYGDDGDDSIYESKRWRYCLRRFRKRYFERIWLLVWR